MRLQHFSSRFGLVFALLLAGCGGGGGAAPAPRASGGGSSALTLRVDVPLVGTAATRRPAYISPGTQSLAIVIEPSGGQPIGAFSVNVTPRSTACQTLTVNGVATLTCSFTFPLALTASGTYTVGTATYDQPQTQQCSPAGAPSCAGNVLSASLLATALQVNAANVISIALGGIANAFTVTPLPNGFIQGNAAGLQIYGPRRQQVVVQALDAGGFTITGSGAPALTLTSGSPNAQVATVSPGVFSLQATAGLGLVTPGVVALTATATPVGNPVTPFSQAVPLTISHTAVFISSVPAGNVLVYFDGLTAVQNLILTTTNQARGAAVDANGTVYVGNHGGNNITECTAASQYATCTTPIAGLNGPEGVAIDGSGNLWVADSGSGNIIEYLAGQTVPAVTFPSGFALLRGVTVDSNGNLWASDQASGQIEGFAPPFSGASTPFATVAAGGSIAAPIEVGADASGDVWVASSGNSTILQFAPPIGVASLPSTTISAGINNGQGVAVDATGTLWIANNGGGGTAGSCLPPPGMVGCSSFTVAGALWIAAYPPAVDP